MVALIDKGEGNGGFPRQGQRQWCPSKARGKAMVSFQGKGEGNDGTLRQRGKSIANFPTSKFSFILFSKQFKGLLIDSVYFVLQAI